ncbi:MAG: hypothetical protein ACR2P0_14670 [Acidimicrobiales bacterium]
MNSVIRRLAPVLLATLALSACGAGGEPDALAVGELSISRSGLNELRVSLQQIDPDGPDLPVTLNADQVRLDGAIWIVNAAQTQYLSTLGIDMSESDESVASQTLEEAIANGGLGPLSRSSEAWAALVRNVWLTSVQNNFDNPESQAAIDVLLNEADVDSRLGVWDPVDRVIVPRVVANP